MPLIEEVTPGTRSQPPSTKNTTKLDATEPSPNSLDPGIYNSLLNMKMGEMNLPTVEKSLPAGLNFQPQTGAAAPQTDATGRPSPEAMQTAMAALSKLSETDPVEFDKVMTRLETDMRAQAEAEGIDIDAAYAKADKMMAEQAKEQAATPDTAGVKMPGGKTLNPDATGPDDVEKGEAPVGKEIQPTPAFVVKSTLAPSGVKLFLNVSTCPDLPGPKNVKRLNAEGVEVEGLSIPVAVGPRRVGGKSGADCVSYDTVVNDVVLEEIEKDVSGGYRDFVCQLVMEYVEQKIRKPKENGGEGDASATVDKRYKLPKLKYHAYVNKQTGMVIPGEILKDCLEKGVAVTAKQMIREQQKEKIQEVKTDSKKAPSKSAGGKKSSTKAAVPNAPLASQKLPMKIEVVVSGEDAVPLEEFLDDLPSAFTDIEPDFSQLPSPNPDGMEKSQLLLAPMLYNASELEAVSVNVVIKVPRDSGPNTQIDVSASMVTAAAPGFLTTTCILPFPVVVGSVEATYDGANEVLCVSAVCMEGDMESEIDVGSRAWSLAEALGGGGVTVEQGREGKTVEVEKTVLKEGELDEGELDEDKFHLKLPNGYNEHSGLYQDGDEDDDGNDKGEYPEDRFHQQDIVSQHLISQRDEDRKKKQDKADSERLERKKAQADGAEDDGIEYLDVDDFKPGGKYHSAPVGSAADEPGNPDVRLVKDETQTKAAKVMKEGVVVEGEEKMEKNGRVSSLESNLWTELLD